MGKASALWLAAEHPTQPLNLVQPDQLEKPGVPTSRVFSAASMKAVMVSVEWCGEKNGVAVTEEDSTGAKSAE